MKDLIIWSVVAVIIGLAIRFLLLKGISQWVITLLGIVILLIVILIGYISLKMGFK